MWNNNRSVFEDHVWYVQNEITNNYKLIILKYYEHVHEGFDLYKYLSPIKIMARIKIRLNVNPEIKTLY